MVVKLRFVWLMILVLLLLHNSAGAISHTVVGNLPVEFLKFVFVIWLNF